MLRFKPIGRLFLTMHAELARGTSVVRAFCAFMDESTLRKGSFAQRHENDTLCFETALLRMLVSGKL